MTAQLHTTQLHRPALLSEPVTARTGDQEDECIALGWPGLDPARACFDIAVFDNSGSMTATGGNDPIGARFRECARAIKLVRAWTNSKRQKLAVVHFDQPTVGDSGVVTLATRDALIRLNASLRVPADARGDSALLPSLHHIDTLREQYPDHDYRLTVFSDFELTDTDPGQVFKRLRMFPGQVHAVVLGGRTPPDLAGPNITITKVNSDDPPGAVAAALHRSMTATRRGRRLSVRHASRTQPSIPPLSPDQETETRS